MPTKFVKGLRKEEATEGTTVTLHCELSRAAPVEWRKGSETLRSGNRVGLRQDGALCELEIRGLTMADTGEYSCVCRHERTSAMLIVRGKTHEATWTCGFMSACCLYVTSSPVGFRGYLCLFTDRFPRVSHSTCPLIQ